MNRNHQYSRVVVGGGLFGAFSALVLADEGHTVLLVEQASGLLERASAINQARLHTGLHYPRSFLTATESLRMYGAFRERFPSAVRDFQQIYAVASYGSKISGEAFGRFIERLGMPAIEESPERWFKQRVVSRAFRVEEPSFDVATLRHLISAEISTRAKVTVRFNESFIRGRFENGGVAVDLGSGDTVSTQGLVLCSYAGINAMRHSLGLGPLPLTYELAEVVLGEATGALSGYGFTVMDGPFWSLMPFGHSGKVTLTTVGLTPTIRAGGALPVFACQKKRLGCTPIELADCNTCGVRPDSLAQHHVQQLRHFLRNADDFRVTGSMFTVKTVMSSAEVDDARPTVILKEAEVPVWTVFSGKISTVLDLKEGLS